MTNDDFQNKVVAPAVAEIQNIFATKGRDYAGDEDRLANFKRIATRLGVSPIKVAGVYLYKHLDALDTWLLTGKLYGEPIESKFIDIIAYILLMQGLNLEQDMHKESTNAG